MQGVSAACLILLLAAGATIAQQCVQKNRVPGVKNPLLKNLNCLFNDDDCDDASPTESPGAADDEECDCVPYYLCDNNTIIDNGKGLLDIRMSDAAPCQDPLEVCCNKPNLIDPNDDDNGPRTSEPLQHTQTPRMGCGKRNKDGVGFQITGNNAGEAQFGEFPWMVVLIEIENGFEKFAGGGSLISPQVVLTAAHSVSRFTLDSSNLRIRAGEWDSQSDTEIIAYQQMEVKEIISHEKFYKGALYNDIALLILHDEIELKDNIGMLCLPAQGAMADSTNCIASGWGKDIFGKAGCYQVILKSILLPIVQRNQCEKMLRNTRLGKRFRLHNSFTCAGGKGGVDACMGDGGGPLACPIPGDEEFYEQSGIIAWGIGCGEENVPGVYTDVSRFRNWVDDKFAERSLDTDYYQRP